MYILINKLINHENCMTILSDKNFKCYNLTIKMYLLVDVYKNGSM